MIIRILALLTVLMNTLSIAAEPPTYEREEVPITAKIASFVSGTGGALLTSGAIVWKCAPLYEGMGATDLMITGTIAITSFVTSSMLLAYIGKNIGTWSDPLIQYFRHRNHTFKWVTNKIADGWNASVYYAFQGYYWHKHIRRAYFQGTFYADNTITYADNRNLSVSN